MKTNGKKEFRNIGILSDMVGRVQGGQAVDCLHIFKADRSQKCNCQAGRKGWAVVVTHSLLQKEKVCQHIPITRFRGK